MDKVSDSLPGDRGFEPHTGHEHDSSYDTSTGWFQEEDSRVINVSCQNMFHIRAKMNMFKLTKDKGVPKLYIYGSTCFVFRIMVELSEYKT